MLTVPASSLAGESDNIFTAMRRYCKGYFTDGRIMGTMADGLYSWS